MKLNTKISEQEKVRINKLKNLKQNKKNPFIINNFNRNNNSKSLNEKYVKYSKQELEIKNIKDIKIAGRLRTIRHAGRSIFANIQDQNGIIQIYIRQNEIGQSLFNEVKNFDIGDIVGCFGSVMKTNTGTLTLRISKIILLSKSLKPLPDKHSGFVDVEERYRKRYLDLIINHKVKETFIKRTKIIHYLREFFNNKGYLEVETPILQEIHGGAAARPFDTYHNSLKMKLHLRIATELHLKRLIVGGFEGVYEIGRLFRNEGISIKHNPEFTTVELYVAYENYNFIMDITEDAIIYILNKLFNKTIITYQGQELNFKKPWKRIHMVDAIKEATGIDFWKKMNYKEAKLLAIKNGIKVEKFHFDVGHIINLFFEKFIEPNLKAPTFIYGYPKVISPLAKSNKNDDRFTDRFELFILGLEYANAFSELNDPIEQYERFLMQLQEKEDGNKEAYELDKDFIEALKYGLPPTGGLGIGIDRLVMLFTDSASIRDVILFPQLKSKN